MITKVLSLFDGISIAQQALKELGYNPEYYSSEIDKYAISITKKNFPDTVQLGNVKEVCLDKYPQINKPDLMIGGFPCIDLSISKRNREGLKGKESSLFYEMLRIQKETNPKWWIYENVASMRKDQKNIITQTLGVEPVLLDAKLLSAQQRNRLFWTNIPNVNQPEDAHIYLKDILQSGEAVKEKAYCLIAHQKDFINDFIKRHQGNYVLKDKPIRIASIGKGVQGDRVYSIQGKSVCLSAHGGGRGAKTGLYLMPSSTDDLISLKYFFRKLTAIECERLQSLQDNFTEKGINEKGEEIVISNEQRYRCLGNGFNCAIIKHVLSNI